MGTIKITSKNNGNGSSISITPKKYQNIRPARPGENGGGRLAKKVIKTKKKSKR